MSQSILPPPPLPVSDFSPPLGGLYFPMSPYFLHVLYEIFDAIAPEIHTTPFGRGCFALYTILIFAITFTIYSTPICCGCFRHPPNSVCRHYFRTLHDLYCIAVASATRTAALIVVVTTLCTTRFLSRMLLQLTRAVFGCGCVRHRYNPIWRDCFRNTPPPAFPVVLCRSSIIVFR